VQVLKFNFQLDELGNPWLLGIKGDMKFEQRSSQAFDDIKAHLLKEVVKVLERKVREQREILALKLKKPDILEQLRDATNADQIKALADETC
jgi:hypothetical protein